MFKQISNLAGDEIYLLISLIIFIAFFAMATVALFRMNKSHVNYMSDIPLEKESRSEVEV